MTVSDMQSASRASEITDAITRTVPARKTNLTNTETLKLRNLTAELIAAAPGAQAEYARFLGIRQRGLCLPEAELASRLDGATVLVTGGTGCIGSTLTAQLATRRPARLVSFSRGVTTNLLRQYEVEYLRGDVRDRARLDAIIAEVRPDVIFHLAAQRSPALAEVEVHRTVTTNVLGTRNVLAAARALGVPQVVIASTGKALRPYSPEIYTASKRAAEWIAATEADDGGLLVSAARFTHVIDNSIVHAHLLNQTACDGIIRLHSPHINFYVQSALESAQLLLLACLGAKPHEFRVHGITDLDWPVGLLDIALGVLTVRGSESPIYLSGYDPGYEEVPFPGLYDPATAGDVSPLLNAFETAAEVPSPCPMINAFTLEMAQDSADDKRLATLEAVCEQTQDPAAIRTALDDLSWSLLDATLAVADRTALGRSAKLTCQHENTMIPVHHWITEAIKGHMRPGASGLTAVRRATAGKTA